MKALFSKQALTFVLALSVSLVGLNAVHAVVIQSQNGNVADEQAIAAEMARLDQLERDRQADIQRQRDRDAQRYRIAQFTKPEKVSLDMQQQTLLSPQRQFKARTPNCN